MSIHEELYEGHLIRANNNAAMIFLDGSKSLETKFRAMDLEDAIKKSKEWIDEKLGGRREERRAANIATVAGYVEVCLLYTSPSPRDKRQSRMPSSA